METTVLMQLALSADQRIQYPEVVTLVRTRQLQPPCPSTEFQRSPAKAGLPPGTGQAPSGAGAPNHHAVRRGEIRWISSGS